MNQPVTPDEEYGFYARPENQEPQGHGNTITIEDCRISTWAKLWGKRIALFSPGMLVSALESECAATGGQLYRAGTRWTALSQHCLCGGRVAKTLDQRTHDCAHCGLHADRDIVSATLAACVDLTDPEDPRTARVDYELAHVLRTRLAPQQEWGGSVNRHQPPAPSDARPAGTGSRQPPAGGLCWARGTRPTPEQTRPPAWTSRDQPKKTAPQAVWRRMTAITGQPPVPPGDASQA
jgi:Putative transposase DNA-binding domain